MKIRPVGAELFHASGSTDRYMMMLIVAFRISVNASNKTLHLEWLNRREARYTLAFNHLNCSERVI
jgi:hypothetical protein